MDNDRNSYTDGARTDRMNHARAEDPPRVAELQPWLLRTQAAAATFLNISPRSVWTLINMNALPHRTCGRGYLFDPDELKAWVREGCPSKPDAAEIVREHMRKAARQ